MSRVTDDRGWITSLRRKLPSSIVLPIRKIVFWLIDPIPFTIKYLLFGLLQNRRYPYKLLNEGDIVVQVGAPRDILRSGRSRSVHFARRVGPKGKVLVVEPDKENVDALRTCLLKHCLDDRVIVVNKGGWREPATLEFISNPDHPAAGRLSVVAETNEENDDKEKTKNILIHVDCLPNIFKDTNFPIPKLISITTNGAEREIVAGIFNDDSAYFPQYFSLAPPNQKNIQIMEEFGYRWVAQDDRGQLFERVE